VSIRPFSKRRDCLSPILTSVYLFDVSVGVHLPRHILHCLFSSCGFHVALTICCNRFRAPYRFFRFTIKVSRLFFPLFPRSLRAKHKCSRLSFALPMAEVRIFLTVSQLSRCPNTCVAYPPLSPHPFRRSNFLSRDLSPDLFHRWPS